MTGAPSTDRTLTAAFFELVYADPDLVRADFADLVDAGWKTSRPDDGCHGAGGAPVGGDGGRHPRATPRPPSVHGTTRDAAGGRGSWRRERSPPAAAVDSTP